jgi:hypothetical protein
MMLFLPPPPRNKVSLTSPPNIFSLLLLFCYPSDLSLSLSLSKPNILASTRCKINVRHISSLLRKANCRLRQIFPILNKSSTTDVNLALIVYKSLLRSIVTYASPAWGYVAESYVHKLQTFQNKVLRIITKLPRVTPIDTLHEQTGMSLIKNYIKGIASRLYLKSASSYNCQIQELGQYDPSNDKYHRPRSLLTR